MESLKLCWLENLSICWVVYCTDRSGAVLDSGFLGEFEPVLGGEFEPMLGSVLQRQV